jgi:hypothetical protein
MNNSLENTARQGSGKISLSYTFAVKSVRAIFLTLPLLLLVGCGFSRWNEDLMISARQTKLGPGESTHTKVERKLSWFRKAPLAQPSKTQYATTSESVLVVEPDGTATCIGYREKPWDAATITAWNGKSRGTIEFDLIPNGPGPSLELIANSQNEFPADVPKKLAPCCSEPLVLKEGQQVNFTVRERASARDLTSTEAGTQYTVFFGSGVPNDPNPSVIVGGTDAASAQSFHLDGRTGTITAPASIKNYNRANVIVFFRNGNRVGWRDIIIIHANTSTGPD